MSRNAIGDRGALKHTIEVSLDFDVRSESADPAQVLDVRFHIGNRAL